MKHVTLIFERDEDGWWVASAKEIAGCHTQGRSIGQARERFVEALGLFVDKPDKVTLVEAIRLTLAARRAVEASAAARAKADEGQRLAQDSTLRAVEKLTRELAMSVRDVGELLGISHQRVQQLARARSAHGQPATHVRRASAAKRGSGHQRRSSS